MMELIKMWPAVLIHRWGLTIAAGFGFLLVGVAVWMATQDRIMLLLSGTVFLLSLGRAALLFRCFVLQAAFCLCKGRYARRRCCLCEGGLRGWDGV